MNVVLLSFNFGQYCIRLANGLAQRSDVSLLLPRAISEPYLHGLDPAVSLVQFDHPRLRQALRQVQMVRRLVREIRRIDPDVIHFQTGHMWFNLGWPLLRRYPLVVTIHDTRHHLGDEESRRTPQWMMDLGYRRADRVIVHGERLRDATVADLGIPPERIDVVPKVPDLVLPPEAATSRTREEPGTVLFFGRIWPYKGLDYLIRAEPHVTTRVPGARFVIAGRGEDLDRYRAQMVHPERFELHDRFIPDPELVELFRRASVVALPYVDGSVSGVIPVAGTFGKPVVATDVGILPEMVQHGRTGLIVPPRDERALADALVRLLEDDALRAEMGRNALERVRTVFSPESAADGTIASYELARASHPRG